jgi:hypothetical protein
MTTFSVNRSGLRMWLVAMAGIPLVVLGLDVLYRRRITNFLSGLVFGSTDPQVFEPRDVIWAIALLIIGLTLSGFGLKELLAPRAVVTADADGLSLRLAGPFRPPVVIPWASIDDIGAEVLEDDGDLVPVMWVRLLDRAQVPSDPWGARWIDPQTVAVLASDWETAAHQVAEKVSDVAVEVSRAAAGPPPSSPPSPFQEESTWPRDVRP